MGYSRVTVKVTSRGSLEVIAETGEGAKVKDPWQAR
jgi:hypothetical protein